MPDNDLKYFKLYFQPIPDIENRPGSGGYTRATWQGVSVPPVPPVPPVDLKE